MSVKGDRDRGLHACVGVCVCDSVDGADLSGTSITCRVFNKVSVLGVFVHSPTAPQLSAGAASHMANNTAHSFRAAPYRHLHVTLS